MKASGLLFFIIVFTSSSIAQEMSEQSPIGYATVEAAFNALESDPDAKITEYEGWTIFN